MNSIYLNLANHLNRLPGGFPNTKSGVELRILKKLFTLVEAKIALKLKINFEKSNVISKRLLLSNNKLSLILKIMSKKGLIFRIKKKNEIYYMAAQFVIGIWEYHVNSLDKELVKNFNEYIPFFSKKMMLPKKTKQLRVIPVKESISENMSVMPYNVAEKIIAYQDKIVVSHCICRKEHKYMIDECNYPINTCFIFGVAADYYVENKIGRFVGKKEAFNILKLSIKLGLIIQAGNSMMPVNICMCCGCCCQILKNLKNQIKPSKIINSNWYAKINKISCLKCAQCIDKCHMEAIIFDNGFVKIKRDRCIGCGVCVVSCNTKSIDLLEKKLSDQWIPPRSASETYLNIAKERGLI